MLDLSKYGGATPYTPTHRDLVTRLTQTNSNGTAPLISDPLAVNALNHIDRALFLPEDLRELAYTDRVIPVAYGERALPPSMVGQLLGLLSPRHGGKYLHLGSGTGYLSTLISYIAGSAGTVYALERVQWLWERARDFSRPYREKLDLQILYRDGWAGLPDKAPYDGIVVTYVYPDKPQHLIEQLAVNGVLLFPSPDHHINLVHKIGLDNYTEEKISDFNSHAFGIARAGVI